MDWFLYDIGLRHERVKLAFCSACCEISLRSPEAEHLCRNVNSISNLQSNFIEIALRQGCSLVNLLHIFRTPFPRNTSELLLLEVKFILYKQTTELLL